MKKYILAIPGLLMAFGASAHSVLLCENFDGPWSVSFPTTLELDHLPPSPAISAMFMNGDGVAMPWWTGRDSGYTTDRFMMSHSYYKNGGTSNDWLVSKPFEVTGKGFTLTFGAQSAPLRDINNLSDLWVYVTETPVSAGSLPDTPALYIERVPYGADVEQVENDFTEYSLSMDPWEGKTVYLCFANKNTDNDILAIDNVLVQRLDNIALVAESPEYTVAGQYDVIGRLEGTLPGGLDNWTLTFESDGCGTQAKSGTRINEGDVVEFTFTSQVGGDAVSNWKLTLTGDGNEPVILKGATTGVLFEPKHRVLLEEATGTWCSNCPYGIYTVECLLDDEEMKESVVPVAVHIAGGAEDFMVSMPYSVQLGLTSAPMMRIDREGAVGVFSGYDVQFDKENPKTLGHRIYNRSKQLTFAEIEMEAGFNIVGNDTVSVKCNVHVTPNRTLADAPYAVGFILTENNVWLEGNSSWGQENKFAGQDAYVPGGMNGWTSLPKKAPNVRFQDVARGIWDFNGINGSLPAVLTGGETYDFEYTLPIPDTYEERESKGKTVCVSPAVVAANLTAIAFMVNQESCEIVNAVAVPMTEQTEKRFTTADLVRSLSSVNTFRDTANGAARYFNLQGIPVDSLTPGSIYVEVKDGKSRKVVARD